MLFLLLLGWLFGAHGIHLKEKEMEKALRAAGNGERFIYLLEAFLFFFPFAIKTKHDREAFSGEEISMKVLIVIRGRTKRGGKNLTQRKKDALFPPFAWRCLSENMFR